MTKFVTLIALLALAMLVIVPASAVNEYRDMNPANDVPDMSTYGYAQYYINAGGSAQDLTVYLQNVKQNLTFDSRWNPDRNDIEGQNGEWTKIQILPDGKSEKVLLSAGETFEACLRNGNGNQPECKRFIVGGADTTAVVFQGAAVTSLGEEEVAAKPVESCKPVVVTASDIYYKGWLGYWFNLKVRGTNEDVFQIAHVTVVDDKDHTLLSAHVIVYGTHHYTIPVVVNPSHKNHNPLTVTVDDSICKDPCTPRGRGCSCNNYHEGIA